MRPFLLWSRGRDGLSPAPVLAVVRLAAAVMLPLVSPRVDEAAVVPLAAVALQEVLAGARLVLGVVVLGDSSFPEINMTRLKLKSATSSRALKIC